MGAQRIYVPANQFLSDAECQRLHNDADLAGHQSIPRGQQSVEIQRRQMQIYKAVESDNHLVRFDRNLVSAAVHLQMRMLNATHYGGL